MYDLINKKSYYCAGNDASLIWSAINEAGRRIHTYVRKELGGFWRVTDTTSLAFTPYVQEYTLPAGCAQITRLREKCPTEIQYRVMTPSKITDQWFIESENAGGLIAAFDGLRSKFLYDGPYLTQASAAPAKAPQGLQPQGPYSIRITPCPNDNRVTELIYPSSFVEIVGVQSPNVIPPEGHGSMMDLAIARLVRDNNDTLAQDQEKMGMTELTEFLTFVRSRQQQNYPPQAPYIEEMD